MLCVEMGGEMVQEVNNQNPEKFTGASVSHSWWNVYIHIHVQGGTKL